LQGDGNIGIGMNAAFGQGACGITQSTISNGVYQINPDFSKRGHFFHPYGQHKAPIGVTVPIGQPDGTIVFTAPMNGCALQVNKVPGSFVFYYDPLSTSMSGNEPGTIVCRVEPKDYDRFERGGQAVKAARSSKYGGTYGVGIFTIHHEGRWKVYSSPVSATVDKKGKMDKASLYTGSITPLMTSFEDS